MFSVDIIKFLRRSKLLKIVARNARKANFAIDDNVSDVGNMSVKIENRQVFNEFLTKTLNRIAWEGRGR